MWPLALLHYYFWIFNFILRLALCKRNLQLFKSAPTRNAKLVYSAHSFVYLDLVIPPLSCLFLANYSPAVKRAWKSVEEVAWLPLSHSPFLLPVGIMQSMVYVSFRDFKQRWQERWRRRLRKNIFLVSSLFLSFGYRGFISFALNFVSRKQLNVPPWR